MTVIPSIAIPVSLIGTFAALNALGFSINVITLFGLVLSIGIVVDDAIIVVENVQRKLTQGLKPRDAAMQAMREVTSPILATSLVLLAVFVPVGFIPGITGKLYQEFALTIAVAVLISTVNALTLSPALCATVLRPHRERRSWFFRAFNRALRSRARPLHRFGERPGATGRGGAHPLCLSGRRDGLRLSGCPRHSCRRKIRYFFVNVQLPPAAALAHQRGDDGSRAHPQGDARHPQRRRDRRLQLPHRHRVAQQRRAVRRARALVRSRYAGAAGKGILQRVRGRLDRRSRRRLSSPSTRRRSAGSAPPAASTSSCRIRAAAARRNWPPCCAR